MTPSQSSASPQNVLINISYYSDKQALMSITNLQQHDFVPLMSQIVHMSVYIEIDLYLEVCLVKSFSRCSFHSTILSSSHTLCSLMACVNKVLLNISPSLVTYEVITWRSRHVFRSQKKKNNNVIADTTANRRSPQYDCKIADNWQRQQKIVNRDPSRQ